MSERTVQHIGDDQLVYGMPKRMVGISANAGPTRSPESSADRHINLIAADSDNILIYYTITYEDWSE